MAQQQQSPVVIVPASGPNVIIRLIWFLVIGWWLGALVSAVAWVLNVTIIFLPLGLWLINRLPTVITLRPQNRQWQLAGGVLQQGQQQRAFLLRALWFVVIGWWFSGVWMLLAYLFLLTVIGLLVAFWMYGRVGAVTTLYRS